MKRFLVTIVLFALVLPLSAQAEDKKFRKEFEEFLQYSLVFDMLDMIKEKLDMLLFETDKVAELMPLLSPEIDRLFMEFMMTEVYDYYKEKLNYKDLKAINKFYRSSTGRKVKTHQMEIITDLLPRAETLFNSIEELFSEYEELLPGDED